MATRRPCRAAGALVGVAMALAACASAPVTAPGRPRREPSAATVGPTSSSPAAAPPTSPTSPTGSTAAKAGPESVRRAAAVALARLIAAAPKGSVSVAAVDLQTGRTFEAGVSSGMWTASAYKLFVVVALLLERQGPDGLGLSSTEIAQCTRAIENSDNRAGYALFLAAGGNAALDRTAKRLHMSHTDADSTDPTFTRTSAADYLRLWRALLDRDGPLDAVARRFVLQLTSRVEADQRWGVGTVADQRTTFYLKNGWLSVDDSNGPDEDDHDRWVVASAGIVRVHSHRLVLAVFSQHNASFGDGVERVEALARPLAAAVTGTVVR